MLIPQDLAWARGTVLVVEDMAPLRFALRDLLQEQGFRVELAADGSQAVQAATRSEPDVVLMDLRLPGVDGLLAIQEVRCIVPLAQFIVYSAQADPATRRWVANECIFRFLAKGVSSELIVEAVAEAVDHKRAIESRSGP